MRLFVAPFIAFSILAGAWSPGSQAPKERPVVLLVHGRGVYGQDTTDLRQEWTRDLNVGMTRAGLEPLDESDVRLAWYADVLDPASDAKCVAPTDTSEIDFDGIARGFLASVGIAAERDGSREARGLLGDFLFVVDPATRCGARRRLESVVRSLQAEGRPVIIVAYSLGSVVAYDLLNALDSTSGSHDIRLITIGSPLAVPALRDLLEDREVKSLRVPASVRSWVNIYDPADAFAAALDLSAPAVENHTLADTAQSDPHLIDHYLRDRETGAAVGRALCASAPVLFASGCAKL